jgi:hypothetical protein
MGRKNRGINAKYRRMAEKTAPDGTVLNTMPSKACIRKKKKKNKYAILMLKLLFREKQIIRSNAMTQDISSVK